MKLFFLFCALFIFQSCIDWKRPEQIKEINRLEEKLSSLHETRLGFNVLDSVLVEVEMIERRLIKYSDDDTLSLSLVSVLDEYSHVQVSLSEVKKQIPTIDSTIDLRNNGLSFLKNDIVKGIGDRSKYNEYILFEESAIEKLTSLVDQCDSLIISSIEIFNKHNAQVKELSIMLERKNQEQ